MEFSFGERNIFFNFGEKNKSCFLQLSFPVLFPMCNSGASISATIILKAANSYHS